MSPENPVCAIVWHVSYTFTLVAKLDRKSYSAKSDAENCSNITIANRERDSLIHFVQYWMETYLASHSICHH